MARFLRFAIVSASLLVLLLASQPVDFAVSVYPAREYLLPLYDNNSAAGMSADWISVNNLNQSETAVVDIFLGRDSAPVASFTLNKARSAGDHKEWRSPGTRLDGPVRVVSRNGQALLVSQRVIYRESFNEILAVDAAELDSEYYFSWYDNNLSGGMGADWITVSNLGDAGTDVDIFVGAGSQPKATLSIGAGDRTAWQSPTALVGGPVRIVSRNGQQLLVSQRVIFRDSFTESLGLAKSSLRTRAYFTWYDNNPAWGMNGDWVCITNTGIQPTTVQIFIGNSPMLAADQPLDPGAQFIWKAPQRLTGGPVQVASWSDQPIAVSQRIIYKNSFEEVPGTSDPGHLMRLPWYDSKNGNPWLHNWVVLGNLLNEPQSYSVSVGRFQLINQNSVPAHSAKTFMFEGGIYGPVTIVGATCGFSSCPSVASQRVIYKNSFNELVASHSSFYREGP